jgi:RimJ/RimL family protein N-acetyltransferase
MMPRVAHPLWPLFDLRLRTANLELRLPTDDDLVALAAVAKAGIHPADEMPFAVPWSTLPSPMFEKSYLQFHWAQRANFRPERWTLDLAVFVDGRPAGFQDLNAADFPVLRTVGTGSWLGRDFQGKGTGKLMRQAVLALAFDHLGAEVAMSGAFLDNPASNRVSEAIGYERNGYDRLAPEGVAREHVRYRLTLEGWRSRPRPAVEVEGLDGCREMFGLPART